MDEDLERGVKSLNNSGEEFKETVLYRVADWVMGVRKSIVDSQPEWYKTGQYGGIFPIFPA